MQKKTNLSLHEFAKMYLFHPLQIYDTVWHEKAGITLGSDGLRIKSEDLLKIGELLLNKGIYKGETFFDSSWLDEATKPHYKSYMMGSYGYHFWSYI